MNDKINAGYGFQLCQPDDPERTHWHCGCECNTWNSLEVHGEPGSHRLNMEWRKPIPLPDNLPADKSEWELVPENEIRNVPTGQWRHFTDCWETTSNDSKVSGKPIGTEDAIAFARRKTSQKIEICHECEINGRINCSEHGRGDIDNTKHVLRAFEAIMNEINDGWNCFKSASPKRSDYPFLAIQVNDQGMIDYERIFHDMHASPELWTHWRSIGPLPKPVDEGEKAWKQWCKEQVLNPNENPTAKSACMAGYAAGLKKGKGWKLLLD